jgi:two-component system, NtrC family, sensor histidine kinase PilS
VGIPSDSRDPLPAERSGHPDATQSSAAEVAAHVQSPVQSTDSVTERGSGRSRIAARDKQARPAGSNARLGDQLLRLIGLRIAIVTSVLLPAFLIDVSAEGASLTFSELLETAALTYIASLVYLGLRLWSRISPAAQAYVQFGGDLLLVSFLVAETGGATSPFSSLYLLVIAVASVMLRRRSGVIIASGAFALYAALAIASSRGWIAGDPPSLERLSYSLLLHFLGFYAIALLTAFLARDVARVERQLEETSEDLADLETLHRDVIASVPSGLATTDLEGRITSINPAGRAILERADSELLGRHVAEVGLMDRTVWDDLVGTSPPDRPRSESQVEIADETRVIGFSFAELLDHEARRRGFTLVFQDLTPWRRLEEQLRIKDRMAAVGELAAGLAHEIGNPLAAISGSVQLLSNVPGRTAAEVRLLRIVLQESQRLDRTIKSFLAYARPAPRRFASFDIGALLAEHAELVRNSKEREAHHDVEVDVDPPAFELLADRDRVQQILWNLSRNALRAMKHGGRLRISGRPENEGYTIRVEDTGLGMTYEQRAKLFHPYTSFFDGGVGIGMAIVYRIVQEHDGEIEVTTGGQGTTIAVRLPVQPNVTSLPETPQGAPDLRR